ncbi:hypothetical protein, conserved [Trypanosoma brucei gambiense DAL972]|uniref:Uncharacterized protein n=1 Tax=Trypanosoma brucei gambiense (strain MHOM/CI/86/DAL972) TaxID=679716 RepID=C9ZIZ8_TRYB9|nr:hypothetical protein, conserved [Trypanosoma brucei gambiense DAL972]CBH09356.1 hypothetical protein, conserved [Trypanosoma brucei gambiense DAL972]|eukprot:XP_011771662.1 hypothetical protein, conserved [Trypanosoma brucei gambiense DAL972]
MWRRHCCTSRRVRFPVTAPHAGALSVGMVTFMFSQTENLHEPAAAGSRHNRHQHNYPKQALFKQLLRDVRGGDVSRNNNINNNNNNNDMGGVVFPIDQPVTANISLLEQLGVMDLMEQRTQRLPTACGSSTCDAHVVCSSIASTTLPPASSALEPEALRYNFSTFTEACRAGVACHIPPVTVLRKVLDAVSSAGNKLGEMVVPSAAATILLKNAAERIQWKASKLQKFLDRREAHQEQQKQKASGDKAKETYTSGWEPFSDRGEMGRLQWALGEEKHRAYELMDMLPLHHSVGNHRQQLQDSYEMMSELRARLQLVSVLQDGVLAVDVLNKLLPFYAEQQGRAKQYAGGGSGNDTGVDYKKRVCDLGNDVGLAILAFRTSGDFTSACRLFEEFNAMAEECSQNMDQSSANENNSILNGDEMCGAATEGCSGTNVTNNDPIESSDAGDHTVITLAATKLKLLVALSQCVGANAAHYAFVQNNVLLLTSQTDVGYFRDTWCTVREAACAALNALARAAMDPIAKMEAAHMFFSRVQQSSAAEVCTSSSLTAALLSVASSARNAPVAVLLYNQLAAPNVRLAEVSENSAALLLSEQCALHDAARYFSLSQLDPLVMPSCVVQLLAAKLMLQQCDSEVIYTVLDLIKPQREVEPQCTFFLRLLAFYRDLQRCSRGWSGEENFAHARNVVEAWRAELRGAGVSTAALTTLRLLRHIRQRIKSIMKEAEMKPEEKLVSLPETTGEGDKLLQCLDGMLTQFSLGWLRHRAATNRTPRFHLGVEQLKRLISAEQNSVTIRTVNRQRGSNASQPDGAGIIPLLPIVYETTIGAAKSRSIARGAFSTLYAVAVEGGSIRGGDAVVLGFSDYVQLCILEDAGMMSSVCYSEGNENGDGSSVASSSNEREFKFSLDSFNSCIPLIYVTDALGELMLQGEDGSVTSAVQPNIDISNFPLDTPVHHLALQGDEVENWLSQWLTETHAFSHGVQGVFEKQMDLMLRTESVGIGATHEVEGEGAKMEGRGNDGEKNEERSRTLPSFVTTATVVMP